MSALTPEDLEAIKARAADPEIVLEWAGNIYADEYIGALQASQDDVMVLVAEVEWLRAVSGGE